MIRELSLVEMEFVSGGDAPPGSGPRPDESLTQYLSRQRHEEMLGSMGIWGAGESASAGGDEVVSTGTRRRGFWSKMFNALDANGDGDLYDEGAIGLGVLGVVLGAAAAATAPIWITGLGVAAAGSLIAGGISGYMDANPNTRIW